MVVYRDDGDGDRDEENDDDDDNQNDKVEENRQLKESYYEPFLSLLKE